MKGKKAFQDHKTGFDSDVECRWLNENVLFIQKRKVIRLIEKEVTNKAASEKLKFLETLFGYG